MTSTAEMSFTNRSVSKKSSVDQSTTLTTGQSILKDAFNPPRKPRLDLTGNSGGLPPTSSGSSDAARKHSAIAMERCLRVPRGKGAHYYLSQKEEEIRDGVLHLKPKFHARADVLFVEFPTPETAKRALSALAEYKVTGVAATRELKSILGGSNPNCHTLDAEALEVMDKNAEILRSYYKDKKIDGRDGAKAAGSYVAKAGSGAPLTSRVNVNADDPFGFDLAAGYGRGSRASSDEGVMQPRSESALGLKPMVQNRGDVRIDDERYGGSFSNVDPSSDGVRGGHGSFGSAQNLRYAPSGPSLLGLAPAGFDNAAAPSHHHPDARLIFERIANSLSRIDEERRQVERQRQQLENEKLRFRKEVDYERMKLVNEWQKVAAERKKIVELTESLKRSLTAAATTTTTATATEVALPASTFGKSNEGQIACQDFRLMGGKSGVQVWTEVCDMKSEKGGDPLIDLLSDKGNEDDDSKSVLAPIQVPNVPRLDAVETVIASAGPEAVEVSQTLAVKDSTTVQPKDADGVDGTLSPPERFANVEEEETPMEGNDRADGNLEKGNVGDVNNNNPRLAFNKKARRCCEFDEEVAAEGDLVEGEEEVQVVDWR